MKKSARLERKFAKTGSKITHKQRFFDEKVRKMIIKHRFSSKLPYKRQKTIFLIISRCKKYEAEQKNRSIYLNLI